MQLKNALKIGARLRGFRKLLSIERLTGRKTMRNGTNTAQPSPTQPISWSYYESIDELPLTIFIKCATSGDFSGLVKSGVVPFHILNSAWLHLHSEYCNRIGGVHISSLITKSRALNALASKVDRITYLVEAARSYPHEAIAAELRAEGYKADPLLSKAEFEQQLNVIMAKLRPERMKVGRMINEMPKDTENKAATERDFTATLIQCSQHEKYRINAKEITTGEYCEYVRRLREYVDAQMKAAKRAK